MLTRSPVHRCTRRFRCAAPLSLTRRSSARGALSFASYFGFGGSKVDGGAAAPKKRKSNELPPMMQWNEQLVNAGLLLLNASSAREGELSLEDENALSNVATVLFSETFATHVEQFNVIYDALSRQAVRNIREIERAVMMVLEMVVPPAVYGVFVGVDVFTGLSGEERGLFHDLVIVLIDGEGNEERLHQLMGTIEAVSPSLWQLPAFASLAEAADELLLKSRLYALITQTCLAFDPERTGKILVSDLKPSLQSVLGEKEGGDLVEKLQPNADGTVFYAQLSSLLLQHGQRR